MTAQSTTPTLEAASREVVRKGIKRLRTQGVIPAVLYGHNQANQSLSLNAHDFTKLYHEAGNTTLLELVIDGKKLGKVLVHEVQIHPTRRTLLHADLYQVNLKEKLTTEIPLAFVGTSDAIEILGGTLLTVRDYVEIECLPDDLIQEIEVDISKLATFDDTIHVADLAVPAAITILDDLDQVIASITEPRSEEELAELDEAPVVAETEFETEDGTKQETPEGEESTEKEE